MESVLPELLEVNLNFKFKKWENKSFLPKVSMKVVYPQVSLGHPEVIRSQLSKYLTISFLFKFWKFFKNKLDKDRYVKINCGENQFVYFD